MKFRERLKCRRIRVWHKNLFGISLTTFASLIFFSCFPLFNLNQLISIQRGKVALSDVWKILHVQQLIVSAVCAVAIAFGLIAALYFFGKEKIERLKQMQTIARMFLENKWYEEKIAGGRGGVLSGGRRKIILPKAYYWRGRGETHLWVMVTVGRYQKALIDLEDKLETALFCDLIEKRVCEPYYLYIFCRLAQHRIGIEEATVKDGEMQLMQNLSWQFDRYPHMLVCGGTGSGKSYFLLSVIRALCAANVRVCVLDPKNSALSDLSEVISDTASEKQAIIDCLKRFYAEMMDRSAKMKQEKNYRTGGNYRDVSMQANFLVFDEYTAFLDLLDKSEKEEVLSLLKRVALLGREGGFFLVLGCQRPDAKYFGEGVRDQFHFRLALGEMSDDGYRMMFSGCDKTFASRNVKGFGYLDLCKGVVTEFWAPYIPAGYDFVSEIGRFTQAKQGAKPVWQAKWKGEREKAGQAECLAGSEKKDAVERKNKDGTHIVWAESDGNCGTCGD